MVQQEARVIAIERDHEHRRSALGQGDYLCFKHGIIRRVPSDSWDIELEKTPHVRHIYFLNHRPEIRCACPFPPCSESHLVVRFIVRLSCIAGTMVSLRIAVMPYSRRVKVQSYCVSLLRSTIINLVAAFCQPDLPYHAFQPSIAHLRRRPHRPNHALQQLHPRNLPRLSQSNAHIL